LPQVKSLAISGRVNAEPALERPAKGIGAIEPDRPRDQFDGLVGHGQTFASCAQSEILDESSRRSAEHILEPAAEMARTKARTIR
jgi:hypothetical protein